LLFMLFLISAVILLSPLLEFSDESVYGANVIDQISIKQHIMTGKTYSGDLCET